MKRLALILPLTALLAAAAVAETGLDAVLVRTRGVVESCRAGSTAWQRVSTNRFLTPGDGGRTRAGAQAKVKLQSGACIIGVGPETRFTVAELNQEFGTAKVGLGWGALRATIGKAVRGQDRFQIVTPNAVLSSQGTDWQAHYVALQSDGSLLGVEAKPPHWQGETLPQHTRAAVYESIVRVRAVQTGETVDVEAGNTIVIGPLGEIELNPPTFPYPGLPAAEAPERPRIERGTTGAGEPPETGHEVEENPSQPHADPTQPNSGHYSPPPPAPPPPMPPPPPYTP